MASTAGAGKVSGKGASIIAAIAVAIGLFVVYQIWGPKLGSSSTEQHTVSGRGIGAASTPAHRPFVHGASPEYKIVAQPNDGNDADDSDWTVVVAKAGMTQCIGDLTGIEQQFQPRGGAWTDKLPASGPVKWRFRSTTGQAERTSYNWDTDPNCSSRIPLY